jgi:hypothetical protein
LSIKISELPSATLPLAGTEPVPIVQTGVTVRAPASAFGTTLPVAAQGDLIYGSAVGVYSALAKDANATRYLSNTGASNNPAWAQVNLANGVTGDLPFANLTQLAGLSVLGVAGNSTADVAAITAGTDNQVLRRSGTAIAFGAVNLASGDAVTGALALANGGTGETSASAAITALLPAQATHAGEFLQTDGAGVLSWAAAGGGGGSIFAACTVNDGSPPTVQAGSIGVTGVAAGLSTGEYNVDLTAAGFTTIASAVSTVHSAGTFGVCTVLILSATSVRVSILDNSGSGVGRDFCLLVIGV